MPDFLDDTLYNNANKARAGIFSAYALLTFKINGVHRFPTSAEKSTMAISMELAIEYATLCIMKMTLTDDEKQQEAMEIAVLKQSGLLQDARFKDI